LEALSPDMRFMVGQMLEQPEDGEASPDSEDGMSTPDSGSDTGRTPLLHAIELGDLGKVMRLLNKGADVHEENQWGETPLFEAAATGDADVVALLFLYGADPDRSSPADLRAEDVAQHAGLQWLLRLFRGERLNARNLELAGMAMCCRLRRLVAEYLWDWDPEAFDHWPKEQPDTFAHKMN